MNSSCTDYNSCLLVPPTSPAHYLIISVSFVIDNIACLGEAILSMVSYTSHIFYKKTAGVRDYILVAPYLLFHGLTDSFFIGREGFKMTVLYYIVCVLKIQLRK